MSVDALFRPFACRSLQLPNRIVMASMARWVSPGGNPIALGPYYRRRIGGGAGLVMTEGVAVGRPSAYNDPNSAHMFGPAVEGWKQVVASIHDAGGKIIPQLWHCGASPKAGGDWQPPAEPESPSGLIADNRPNGRIMTEADIADVIAAYARAAEDAKRAGFDGIEVHTGHGYLLDQFMWHQTNHRTDRWGGKTLLERTRFPLEVIRAVRKAMGPDLPLFIRMSSRKTASPRERMVETPAELEAWMVPFVDAGVDLISVSTFRYDEPYFAGSTMGLAGWVKKVTGVPVAATGAIGMSGDLSLTREGVTGKPLPVDDVAQRIDAGEFDLAVVGRALLADPQWTRKVKEGRTSELKDCPPEALASSVAD